MGIPNNGTLILGAVVPFNSDDVYDTHKAKFGQGGWRTVADLNERDVITELRRENLMIVAVQSNSYVNSTSGIQFYILDVNNISSPTNSLMDNNNWFPLEIGYGGDGWIFPAPTQSEYNGTIGQRSFDSTYFYICVDTNIWRRVELDYFSDTPINNTVNVGNLYNNGDVPIWDGTLLEWGHNKVVKSIVDNTTEFLITYTDDTFLNIPNANGDNWINTVPSSSTSIGVKGQRVYDDDFLYICIQTNTWKRINLDYFSSGSFPSTPFDANKITTVNSNYTLLYDDVNLEIIAPSGNFTISIPAISTINFNKGKSFKLNFMNLNSNTINLSSIDKVNNVNSINISTNYLYLELFAINNTEWILRGLV